MQRNRVEICGVNTSHLKVLTDEEKREQQTLREEYVADFRKSLKAQLDNTVVINPDGTSYKLKQEKDKT